ncbi:methyl-accepting chemotaxis protein [Pseudoduganella flava]|uniref:methyl-accepting chemotaxis protein n=1 Tax=Pseudoduganella flava TaxID=871742 RepID=UPI001E48725D|nr:methyl-accepting chemotaxis protein [Pseudoduganella flava]
MLAAFFLVTVLLVGFTGWNALRDMNQRNAAGFAEAGQLMEAVDSARSAQVEFKVQVQEWKNILLRGKDAATLEKYTKAFGTSGEATTAELKELKGTMAKLGLETAAVDEALRVHGELVQRYMQALKQFDGADPQGAQKVDALVKGMDREPTEKIDAIVAAIQKEATARVKAVEEQNDSVYRNSVLVLLALLAAAVAFGSLIVVMLIRGITVPLSRALEIAQEVAAGDLRNDVQSSRQDEIGELLRALSTMSGNLSNIVARVRTGTQAISLASAEIATGNADLSARTETQASSLEETASSMSELTSTVRQNSDNANTAAQLAEQATAVSTRGSATVAEVVATMSTINGTSGKIAEIIGVIDGIAFQTNILALNAAVEAARAGEQGRGFAVVAGEVRNLAQRSSLAAKEIRELITASVSEVETGRALVDRAGATMREVLDSVQQVTAVVQQISLASGEQQQGIEQIGEAVSFIDSATQQNAALVEEAAAAAESLREQARQLDDAVAVFKLRGV